MYENICNHYRTDPFKGLSWRSIHNLWKQSNPDAASGKSKKINIEKLTRSNMRDIKFVSNGISNTSHTFIMTMDEKLYEAGTNHITMSKVIK